MSQNKIDNKTLKQQTPPPTPKKQNEPDPEEKKNTQID
jgi:hypothetical protein